MPFFLMAVSEERNRTSDFAVSGSLAPAGMMAEYTIIFCNSPGDWTNEIDASDGQKFVGPMDADLGIAVCDSFANRPNAGIRQDRLRLQLIGNAEPLHHGPHVDPSRTPAKSNRFC